MFRLYLCAAAISLFPSITFGATLKHHFDFEADANDHVGGVVGNLIGGAFVSGGLLHLDGVDDYLQASIKLLPQDGSDFTLAFKARNTRSSQSGIQEIVSQGSSGGPGFYVGNINGKIRFSDQFGALTTPTPTDGRFHDYVITSETSVGTKFYLDETLIFSSPSSIFIGGVTPTRVGTQFNAYLNVPFNEYFEGQVDVLKVFQGALTNSEVRTVFDASAPSPVPLPASFPLLISVLAGFFGLTRFSTRS